MGRLLAIDFGRKRCGLAVTDPLQLVGNGLVTVRTCDLIKYIQEYCSKENVDAIILGNPTTLRGEPSESQQWLKPTLAQLRKALPHITLILYDERFTSLLAHKAMLDGGLKKTDRQDKALVDKISAAIILNDYLSSKQREFKV